MDTNGVRMEFEGKVALITGATSGIGEATAKEFARNGARVVLGARRSELGEKIIGEIKATGGDATFIETDIQTSADVREMVKHAETEFGRLDFAVNNAGVEQYFKPLPAQSENAFDVVMGTNVKGVWMSMQHEIPLMLKSGGGAIVNVSSVFGVTGAAYGPLYSASKHAVIGLTKSVALEFAKSDIRVNAVLPAAIDTPMITRLKDSNEDAAESLKKLHPIGRVGTPLEVANACLWLCSERASFVTGSSLTVDGGYTAQ